MSDQGNGYSYEIFTFLCEKLAERSATLFLGAGINAGVKNSDGETFPLGNALSAWISKDILEQPELEVPLTESSEIARYKVGPTELNKYIFKKFATFSPGTAHLSLVQLPWDAIFTTNYDHLVEDASEKGSVSPAGKIRQVFSETQDLSSFKEEDILYYKLHGSIDFANTAEGRLILTKEDYRYYESNRKPLFKRLKQDLLTKTFLFIGYSLTDENFRSILDDALEAVGIASLPLSYCIQHSFLPVQETYWREKYNIQLIQADGAEFLNELKINWIAQEKIIVPLELRRAKEYLQFDDTTQFPKVAESFYQVHPDYCNGLSRPKKFFLGAEPTWNDIKQKVMSERDAYWTILESLFPELGSNILTSQAYLITGSAGTGKTTLLYSIALDIAKAFSFPILVHIPDTPLHATLLKSLLIGDSQQRIIVVIRHAADYIREIETFINDAKSLKIPLTVLLEERRNEWNVAANSSRSRLQLVEFELSTLSEREIENILDRLRLHSSLGKLTDVPVENQVQHFKSLAHKDLLVAMRELTSDGTFDEIVKDEYDNIPSDIAKLAYRYVSTIGQLGIPVRFEVLIHILGIEYTDLQSRIFRPAEGILMSGELSGGSRFSQSFKLSVRHPIIASIIFDYAAPVDEAKISILISLINNLDIGHREDRKLLDAIVKRRELVNTLSSIDSRRLVYEALQRVMPTNQFVLQHRSILERDIDNPDDAIKFARLASKLDPTNPAIINTLGLALEYKSRSETDPLKYQALISEALRYFEEGISGRNNDPFAYLGKYYILKQKADRESDAEKRVILRENIMSFVEEAYEATDESEVISNILALSQDTVGEHKESIEVLERALDRDKTNRIVRDRLITYLSRSDPKRALKIALDGTQYDVTAWKIQRHVARLMSASTENDKSTRGYYEAAIRHNKGSLNLQIEYGSFLFARGLYPEAMQVFNRALQLPVSTIQKKKVQRYWTREDGHKVAFMGRILAIKGALVTIVAVPQNFQAPFWRSVSVDTWKDGDEVLFNLGFNAYGPLALNVRKERVSQ